VLSKQMVSSAGTVASRFTSTDASTFASIPRATGVGAAEQKRPKPREANAKRVKERIVNR